MNIKLPALLTLTCCLSSCSASPVFPSSKGANATDAAGIVGELAVAFLNRFSASSISPQACLVDFTSACRGTADEFSDITYNRAHFEILGARLGAPTVTVSSSGASANIQMFCSWDSRTIMCDQPGCVEGAFGSVAGTCILTSVREASGWKLCTSNFSGSVITPSTKLFFGPSR